MLKLILSTVLLVAMLFSFPRPVTGQRSSCRPVGDVFAPETASKCQKYVSWYDIAFAEEGDKDLVQPKDYTSTKCRELLNIFFCLQRAGSCYPKNMEYTNKTKQTLRHLNPCRSFCTYMKNDCGLDLIILSCEHYKNDAPPVTREQFQKGAFLDYIFDEQGRELSSNMDRQCVPHYIYDESEEEPRNCPSKLKTKGNNYDFMGGENCGAPCNKLLFSESNRAFLRKWTFGWSVLCLISCLFTFTTYLLDRGRFNYPEVSIIYFSFCYIFISLSYITGFIAGDSFSCNSVDLTKKSANDVIITQSLDHFSCTISFVVLYYFTMASALWWVVLCFTWYLTAGLKWSHEAIASKAFLFHAIVWLLPLGLTVAVLVLNGVEGDDLTGTCLTGTISTDLMKFFVFGPLLLFLVTGFAFIVFGLISMCRIRSVVKVTFDSKSADSFQKLMLRIGLFSLFYMVPMSIVVACYYYEIASRAEWFGTWFRLSSDEPASPADDAEESAVENKTPEFKIFLLKYFLSMVVGIASLFWVMSYKTINLWLSVFCACTEIGRDSKRKTLAQDVPIKQLGITANPEMAIQIKNMTSKDVSPSSNEDNTNGGQMLLNKAPSHPNNYNLQQQPNSNASIRMKNINGGYPPVSHSSKDQCFVWNNRAKLESDNNW